MVEGGQLAAGEHDERLPEPTGSHITTKLAGRGGSGIIHVMVVAAGVGEGRLE